MTSPSRGFGSDNHSGAHPKILQAFIDANAGHVPSYGTCPLSEQAYEMLRGHFGPQSSAYFVFNGTGANVLSFATLVRPHHAIVVSATSHMQMDECGAPEKHLGCKLVPVETANGKLTPDMIRPHLIRRGDQHYSQVRAVSITQSTELGTVYSPMEVRALAEFCRSEKLFLHMDGSRLVNAAASLGVSLREITTDCGVDVLSLGGTKNGMVFGEAVVFLKPGLDEDFKYARKQLLQLPSKTRFIAAQFMAFLGTDLWLENARHANAMAKRLADGLKRYKSAKITQETQANGVFVIFPRETMKRLREVSFFYVWDEHTLECRLMTSWDTQAEDVERFLRTLETIEAGR